MARIIHLLNETFRPTAQPLAENKVVRTGVDSFPRGEEYLITEGGFEFWFASVPPDTAELGELGGVMNDGVVRLYADESMVKGAMVQGAKSQSVLDFIRSMFVLYGNDVGCIQQIELEAAHAASVAISCQHVATEARITNLAPNGFENCAPFLWELFPQKPDQLYEVL